MTNPYGTDPMKIQTCPKCKATGPWIGSAHDDHHCEPHNAGIRALLKVAKDGASVAPRSMREGEVMGAYVDFDRAADKAWSSAEYLTRFGLFISRRTVAPHAEPSERTVASISDEELVSRALQHAVTSRPRRQEFAWAAVSEAFALGSTFSQQLLRRFGFDPDSGKKAP